MNKLKTLALIWIAVSCCALLGCSYEREYRSVTVHGAPAPGFCIATNQYGAWRGMREHSGYVLTPYSGDDQSKQAAIERTWGQYEYEITEDQMKWSRAQ